MSLRDLIPNPIDSDKSHARFVHADVGDLSLSELWAEQAVLEAALARRIAWRVRPRLLPAWPPALITDREWLLDRLRALRHEQERRGSSRG